MAFEWKVLEAELSLKVVSVHLFVLLGPRPVHKEHQGGWGRHPDGNQASQWADRHQGIRYWSGCTCPVGPGCWQTNTAEWTAPASKCRGCATDVT